MKKTIKMSQIYNKPLAIQPDFIANINLDFDSKIITQEQQDNMEYFAGVERRESLAIVPISGVLEPNFSIWSFLFGGTSTLTLQDIIVGLIEDEKIKTIVLDIDSPGGDITGIQTLSDILYDARDKKEIIAIVKDLAASAAYWVAAGASKVYMSSETAMAGSIGVVSIHRDFSEYQKKEGIKATEIYAGKYKRLVSNYKPLDEDGKNYLQNQVDYLYSIFVKNIAKLRGKTEDFVMQNMAEGKLLIGEQAIDVGLADEFRTINNIKAEEKEIVFMKEEKQDKEITEDYLVKNNPNLFESIKKKAYEEGKKFGVKQEKERILAIQNLSVEGFEEIIKKAIESGITPEATGSLLWKEEKSRGITLSDLKQDNNQVSYQSPDEKTEEEKDKEKEKQYVDWMTGGDK